MDMSSSSGDGGVGGGFGGVCWEVVKNWRDDGLQVLRRMGDRYERVRIGEEINANGVDVDRLISNK